MDAITNHAELADAIREAAPGATIAVATEVLKELGERAGKRMGREDLVFVVVPMPHPI